VNLSMRFELESYFSIFALVLAMHMSSFNF